MRTMTMRHNAELAWRSPPRFHELLDELTNVRLRETIPGVPRRSAP
jgi:hypothetical protein